MESLTLAVAAVVSTLIFFLSPTYALIAYIALSCYPSYLTVSVGTIDFTARKIVILVLFAKLFLQTDLPGRFKFVLLDKLVIVYFVAQLLAGAVTSSSVMSLLENRAGQVCDLVLPYFAIRMIILSRQQYFTLLKSIMIMATPLAILGFYECITGYNPADFLLKYHGWADLTNWSHLSRHGLYRAYVVFSNPITYGFFFAMFGPVCLGIVHSNNRNLTLGVVFGLLMWIGIFSSVSSGPILTGLMAILFMVFYAFRKYWKVALLASLFMCVVVEFVSDRHFYNIIGDFTFNPSTAWYRGRLIEVALFEGGMSGHWLMGFGYETDPGWCAQIDGRNHTDIVNHFLWVLSRFGLVSLLPFLALNIVAVRKLIDAYKITTTASDRWLVWCLASGFFGIYLGFFTVSLFDFSITVYYMLIGFAGSMPAIISGCNTSYYSRIRSLSQLEKVRK